MSEPFKNVFNAHAIKMMAINFARHSETFDANGFEAMACQGLEQLELKERSDQITAAMKAHLPEDFELAANILLSSLLPVAENHESSDLQSSEEGVCSWAIMPMAHYVALQGQAHHVLSMALLNAMTRRFTAEFAIRFFLIEAQTETLAVLRQWINDPDRHVRRLVSEGTRSRLPWGMQLPAFIKDPAAVIELLERLKDDKDQYVRRSVANNLNDIAKDHPDLVVGIARRWMKDASDDRIKLIRHACRTLFKQGNAEVLAVFGFTPPKLESVCLDIHTPTVLVGGVLEFSLSMAAASEQEQPLMIDYIVHHQKKNGSTTPKVFKWKKLTLKKGKALESSKKHSFKVITTRVYYPGLHALEIVVNGVSIAKSEFYLEGA